MKSTDNPHLTRFAPVPEIPAQDEDGGLPNLKSGNVASIARAANKPCFSINFIQPDGTARSMQYAGLDSNANFTPEYICLKFMGMEPTKVLIYGRNLWPLYDYIMQHRMPWVMIVARDMGQDGEAIVTEVRFEKMAEED